MDIRYGERGLDRAEAERLWQRAERTGGPVAAPGTDGPGSEAVTFLWRGDHDRVVLVGPLADHADLRRTELTRVSGTDLWHLTLLLPAGLRAAYAFAIDEPHDDLTGANWSASLPRWHTDPLNRRTFRMQCDETGIDPDPHAHTLSVLELPGAGPSRWTAPNPAVPTGRVTMHWFRAADTGLDTDHRVWVYEPVGAGPYPVAVLFDGDAYVAELVPTPRILDNLIAAGEIPPTLGVFVDSSAATRTAELRGDPKFVAFLTDQLLPWVAERWPVTTDPARTVVGGSSLGGTCATYAALRAPERFGLVLSQSGAFQQPDTEFPDGLPALVAETPRRPVRWYLEVGVLDTDRGTYPTDILSSNRHLRDVLTELGYPLQYTEFVGGHDYVCWRETLAYGLIDLLGAAG
ncbi:MAG TPA: alpha/beta hydrolase-fold protein [Actinocatenispora sp.]